MMKEYIFDVEGKRISIKAESLEEAVKELKGKRVRGTIYSLLAL